MSHEATRERAAVTRRGEFKQLGIDLAAASDYLTQEARQFAITNNQQDLKQYWDEINITKSQDRVVNRLKELGAPADELDLIAEAKRNSDVLVSTESRSMRLVLEATGVPPSAMLPAIASFTLSAEDRALPAEAKLAKAREIMFDDKYEQDRASIMDPIAQFQKRMNDRAEGEVKTAEAATSKAIDLLVVFAVAVPLLLAAVLRVFHLKVTKVMSRYIGQLRQRDSGDLTFSLVPEGTRELEELAEAFNQQFGHVFELVKALSEGATSLSTASDELTAVSEEMAESAESASVQAGAAAAAAEQVSSNVGTAATGTEEMGASIREIAKNAGEAADVAAGALQVAEDAGAIIAKLGESSAEIGGIISVITSVAEQTNLLP